MPRMIDADNAISFMKERAGCNECESYNGVRCRACTWDDAIACVDDFADAADNFAEEEDCDA